MTMWNMFLLIGWYLVKGRMGLHIFGMMGLRCFISGRRGMGIQLHGYTGIVIEYDI
jgi:hypothetical protein